MTQDFQNNETVIVTRGSKSLAKGTEATVLGYDQPTDSYAVRIATPGDITRYTNVKASALGAKPERTFTESEVREALDDSTDFGSFRAKLGIDY